MVASTLARWRGAVTLAGAGIAVGFLVAMAMSGGLRESGQFVRFVAAGVLRDPPEQIDRIEVAARGRRWVFVRSASGWHEAHAGRAVPAALAKHLDDAVKFLHVSAPIRVLEHSEWAREGLGEFGLDPPAYAAALFQGGRRRLAAAFGSPNPQRVLQYMRIDGREEIYVMSRFIGQEWEEVIADAGR